jgi:MFS family permease
VIGPFAGVLLDRWRRQRVLVVSNLVRAGWIAVVAAEMAAGSGGIWFYASALVVVSISRFVLSALSAALPHVVPENGLLTANALSSTAGGVVATLGGALAIGLRGLIGSSGGDYAVLALVSAVLYAAAAVPARPFEPDALGPDEAERARRETVPEVARGLLAGLRHLGARPQALSALLAITVHRLAYGVTLVCSLLLYRNYFASDGFFRAGLGGIAQAVAAVGVGTALAAVVTPFAARRLGYVRWPVALLLAAAAVQVALALPYRIALMLVAALLLGFVAQGIKICVDTIVQRDVDDAFRGRVFAVYDMLFNVTLVIAAVLTSAVLPADGHSPASVVAIAGAYALTAAGYARWGRLAIRPAPAHTTA